MHPILFSIPLNLVTLAVVALLFGVGGVIRARFVPAEKDASYLASFLGLNVQWGKVAAPWGKALFAGVKQAVITAALGAAAGLVVKQVSPRTTEIPLHIYGLMMATAFIVGIWLSTREATHERLPNVPLRDKMGRQLVDKNGNKLSITSAEMVSDLAFYLLVAGLVGSRILYIVTRWDAEYSVNPGKVFRVWEGGLVWYGGLIAATLVAYWFVRTHKISFWPYADVLVPAVSLGHGIGRLGCFAAGCCFGNVAMPGFPLAVQFPQNSPAWGEHLSQHLINAAASGSLPVYPTQIIESLGELLIFFALLFIRSRKRFHGQVVLSYFFLYPILRTIIEMFRGDSIRGFVFRWPNAEHPMLLSTSQAASIVVAIAGIVATSVVIRQKARAQEASSEAVKPA